MRCTFAVEQNCPQKMFKKLLFIMINALATPKEKSLMHLNAIKQKASNTKSAVRTPQVSFQIIAKNNGLIFEAILFSANFCCLTAVKFPSIILVARIVSFKKANKQAD